MKNGKREAISKMKKGKTGKKKYEKANVVQWPSTYIEIKW